MTTSRKRFAAPQRLLHWLMAICILSMLFIGVGMVSTVTPKYLTLVQIHKPLGIAILVLALIRLALRFIYGSPALPPDLPEPIKLGAVSVAICPLRADDRYAAASAGECCPRRPTPWCCSAACICHPILPLSPSLHTLLWHAHYYLAFAFFAIILMHVAAILFHKLIRNDGIFETMAPVLTHDQSE